MNAKAPEATKIRPADIHLIRIPHDWTEAAQKLAGDGKSVSAWFREVIKPLLAGEVTIIRNAAGEVTSFMSTPGRRRRLSGARRRGRPSDDPQRQDRKDVEHAVPDAKGRRGHRAK